MTKKSIGSDTDEKTRDRILAAAWSLFQRNSTSNFTLTNLADQIGLHYTVIYHYFKNKLDLKAEIIEMHSAGRSKRLARICSQGGSGFSQLAGFIHAEMSEMPNNLLVHQNDLFTDPYRTRVSLAAHRNFQELARVVQHGIDDGSIRHCQPEMAARLILRILNRYANQNEDLFANAGLSAGMLAKEIVSFLKHGILGKSVDARDIRRKPVSLLPVLQTTDSNLDLMLRTLTGALNKRGYDATSIPEVAASIGLSKTSFYRFAANKEDLLYLAAHRTLALNMQVRQVARAVGSDPLDKLLHIVFYSRHLLDHEPGPTMHPSMFYLLSNEHARAAWDIFNAGRFDIIGLLKDGMSQGLLKEADATAIQPMLNSIMTINLAASGHDGTGFIDDDTEFLLYGIARKG